MLNEPETSLHPDLLPALARLIARAATRSQVIVVSHAPRLIAAHSTKRLRRHELPLISSDPKYRDRERDDPAEVLILLAIDVRVAFVVPQPDLLELRRDVEEPQAERDARGEKIRDADDGEEDRRVFELLIASFGDPRSRGSLGAEFANRT